MQDFEDATEVTLVGEARIACDGCEIGPTGGQGPAGKLHSQTIHEFGHRAADDVCERRAKDESDVPQPEARFLQA